MSSINNKWFYRYYCLINTSKDFKNLSLFSNIVDSHDISISSKKFNNPEECVISCANLVKTVMLELNKSNNNSYQLLWDTADKLDLNNSTSKEITVAKFYLVDKSHLGKSIAELPTSFSASVVKLNNDSNFELTKINKN